MGTGELCCIWSLSCCLFSGSGRNLILVFCQFDNVVSDHWDLPFASNGALNSTQQQSRSHGRENNWIRRSRQNQWQEGPSGDRIWFCINIDNPYLRVHLGDVEPKAGSWRKGPSGTHADWLPWRQMVFYIALTAFWQNWENDCPVRPDQLEHVVGWSQQHKSTRFAPIFFKCWAFPSCGMHNTLSISHERSISEKWSSR